MSGRSCSRAMKALFITQSLRMHEGPDRAIADLETTLCQFANQTAEREVAGMAPLDQPDPMLTPDPLRPIAADPPSSNTSSGTEPLRPLHRSAHRHPKLRCCLMAGRTTLDRADHSLPKVNRIRSPHLCWPPSSQQSESHPHRAAESPIDSNWGNPALVRDLDDRTRRDSRNGWTV